MRTHFNSIQTGGINAAQPLDQMPPTDAIRMINLLPREEYLEFRKGTLELTTSALATAVDTLATHRDSDGTETLVCASNANIYSVNTSTGATTSKGSGFSNNRWQTVNFNDRLLMVNGEDTPQEFDGSTLQDYVATISGATATDLVGVTVFKGRCIYWENNSAEFWYAGAGAYGGALTSFPLALTTKKGGYVKECFTWNLDSGDGVDDLFVVVMSTGETLAYQGSDPASDFSLIGSFTLGKPVSIRGSASLGGDRIMVTEDGFINLSTALQIGRTRESGNVGSKIINIAKETTGKYADNNGWELIYHDKESLLIVNVPISSTRYNQYVMNTNTGAWSMLRGIDAISYTEVDGVLYAGSSDGHIRQLFTGTSDDGEAIHYVLIPAFSMLGMATNKKNLTYVSMSTNFSYKQNIGIGSMADFKRNVPGGASVPDQYRAPEPIWDEIDWDEAFWGEDGESGDPVTYNFPCKARGFTVSFKMNIYSSVQTAKIYGFRYKFKMMRSI